MPPASPPPESTASPSLIRGPALPAPYHLQCTQFSRGGFVFGSSQESWCYAKLLQNTQPFVLLHTDLYPAFLCRLPDAVLVQERGRGRDAFLGGGNPFSELEIACAISWRLSFLFCMCLGPTHPLQLCIQVRLFSLPVLHIFACTLAEPASPCWNETGSCLIHA